MPFKGKLALLLLVPMVPMGFMAIQVASSLREEMTNASHAVEHVRESALLGGLIHELQKERGLTVGYVSSGGTKYKAELDGQRKLTDTVAEQIRSSLAHHTQEELEEPLKKLKDLSRTRTQADELKIPARVAGAYFTTTIAGFAGFLSSSVSELQNPNLIQGAIVHSALVNAKETMGQQRALLNGALLSGQFQAGGQVTFAALVAAEDAALSRAKSLLSKDLQMALNEALTTKDSVEANNWRDRAATGDLSGIKPELWWEVQTSKINSVWKIESKVTAGTIESAKEFNEQEVSKLTLLASAIVVSLLVGIVMVVMIAKTILTQLSRLQSLADKAGEGDLSTRIAVPGTDEFSQLAKKFHQGLDRLGDLIFTVQDTTERVSDIATSTRSHLNHATQASHEVHEAVTATANSTESISADLQSASQSVKSLLTNSQELDSTMTDLGEAAEHLRTEMRRMKERLMRAEDSTKLASELSNESSRMATEGEEIVAASSESMEKISESTQRLSEEMAGLADLSKRVGKIINVIEDITNQTGLLSLNAAIEAARAGEHGKGFAVVAEEVGKLAEKSKDATKEIQEILGSVSSKVEGAVVKMEENIEAVTEGAENVSKAQAQFRDISEGAREMVLFLEETRNAMASLVSSAKELDRDAIQTGVKSEESLGLTKQMVGDVQEVSMKLESISAVGVQIAASSEEVAATTDVSLDITRKIGEMGQELEALSGDLTIKAKKFILAPRRAIETSVISLSLEDEQRAA
ncbi:MAG: methyl-accepting chemotaxis protein [Fimbriimonadaceae bacterium]|nr:methyl-accepting chemotaxis protein [Fimbriimonadaceae bacterium]